MANYYLKLYFEILDDYKMCMLSDHLYRRVIEIFLLAGVCESGGMLPPLKKMTWKLRISEAELLQDLQDIHEQTNIVHPVEGGWMVTNFAKRQAPSDPTAAERMKRFRERNTSVTDKENVTDVTRNVTRRVKVKDIEIRDTEKTPEKKKELKVVVEGENAAAAAIFSAFQNNIQMLTAGSQSVIDGWIDDYPSDWILEAIQEAVKHNKRNIAYITAILKSWKANGKNAKKPVTVEKPSEVY